MDRDTLKIDWLKDENQSMQGWDFSYIKDRWQEEPLSFDYIKIVQNYLSPDDKLLDMGTGGGELLLSLNHPYTNTYATESYPPNIEYCKKNLTPLGITVEGVQSNGLPFDNNFFDIVINRHDSYNIDEIKRVLKPNGYFITQQVGALNNQQLSRFFIEDFSLANKDGFLDKQQSTFIKSGFDVLRSEEYFPTLKFFDVGAFVFFAKIIEWEFPDFSVEKYFDKLLSLHKECKEKGYIESKEHRYMLVCRNDRK